MVRWDSRCTGRGMGNPSSILILLNGASAQALLAASSPDSALLSATPTKHAQPKQMRQPSRGGAGVAPALAAAPKSLPTSPGSKAIKIYWQLKLEMPRIELGTSRMLSGRSTI